MAKITPPSGSSYTDAEAIAAVEAEDPLDLAGDVNIDGAKSLAVDVITEKDAAAGVTVDGTLIKDGAVDGVDLSSLVTPFPYTFPFTFFVVPLHASFHSDGGTDEVTVENLATAGANGKVPTSDGAGGLTMETPAAGGSELTATKTSATSVTDDDVLTDDPDLQVTVVANTVYHVLFLAVTTTTSNGLMKIQFNAPSVLHGGCVALSRIFGEGQNAGTMIIKDDAVAVVPIAQTDAVIYYEGYAYIGASGGTFAVQWAQNVSHADASSMDEGSALILTPIGLTV